MYMHLQWSLFFFSSCTCSVVITYCNLGKINIDLCQNNLCGQNNIYNTVVIFFLRKDIIFGRITITLFLELSLLFGASLYKWYELITAAMKAVKLWCKFRLKIQMK